MKTVTPTELAKELHAANVIHVVDVREPREYSDDLGHIAGSHLVPLGELEEVAKRWERSRPIVLVCRSGSRSAIGCGVLEKMGFESVTNLAGGMLAWRKAGLPVEH